ncbi:MAG: hypothetical protein SWO11_20890 [Thermodesulfobacteriota bacterium]|nr:hypothetical protein [Thermodesulfobacteriota bacterium]
MPIILYAANAQRMSDAHGGKQACPRGHRPDPLVGRSIAEANKLIFDPWGIGAPRSGAPTMNLNNHSFPLVTRFLNKAV